MSLQSRLSALITAIGADIKTLQQQNHGRGASITHNANQTPSSGAVVSFNTVLHDDASFSATANKLTALKTGWHTVELVFQATATNTADANDWRLVPRKNGTNIGDANIARGSGTGSWAASLWLTAGDVIDVAYVASAGSWTIGANERSLRLSMVEAVWAATTFGDGAAILASQTAVSDTEQPDYAVEWRSGGTGGALVGKLVTISPIISSVVVNRSELRARVKSRDGTLSAERLILDSDGNTNLSPPFVTALPTVGAGTEGALVDGQECYYLPDPSNTTGNGNVVWHLKYRASDGKWYCVGGSPVIFMASIASNVDITSTTYATFTSAPSFTAAIRGDYRVHFGHAGFATSQISMLMGPSVNGAAPVTEQTDSVQAGYGVASVDQYGVSRSTNVTTTTNGHTIALRARVSSGTGKMRMPWMEVMPLRLG